MYSTPITQTNPPCVPAQNVLWFWFDPATARKLHGTVNDAARKLQNLTERGMLLEGLEIFLMPSRVGNSHDWPKDFCRAFADLSYRTVHIGETENNFLLQAESPRHLRQLHAFLDAHGVKRIILHSHHLENSRQQCRENLLTCLPGIEICVENTGFNNITGHEPEFMIQLCKDFPECTICLDIAHVQDFPHYKLSDFTENPIIRQRIREIHASFSTYNFRSRGIDLYEEKGFPGYDPYHALYSVLNIMPDDETSNLMKQHPVVLEGVLPREDASLEYLFEEQRIISNHPHLQKQK